MQHRAMQFVLSIFNIFIGVPITAFAFLSLFAYAPANDDGPAPDLSRSLIQQPAQTYLTMATITADAAEQLFQLIEEHVEDSPEIRRSLLQSGSARDLRELTLEELGQ